MRRARLLMATVLAAGAVLPAVAQETGFGPSPALPPPKTSLIPTVNIARVDRWPAGEKPDAARGFMVERVRRRSGSPALALRAAQRRRAGCRDQRAAEPRRKGVKDLVMKQVQKVAGAGVPSANRITLLRDADGDGRPETRSVFLSEPALALRHGPGRQRLLRRQHRRRRALPLPAGRDQDRRRRHQGRRSAGRPDQPSLDQEPRREPRRREALCRRRLEQQRRRERHRAEDHRAAILEIDVPAAQAHVFASGLRNPVGMDWQPQSDKLWVAVNERDELGDDLVPDYMTSVQRRAPSTAGRTATTATMSTRASSRRDPSWSPRRSSPTMRWAPTPPRSG